MVEFVAESIWEKAANVNLSQWPSAPHALELQDLQLASLCRMFRCVHRAHLANASLLATRSPKHVQLWRLAFVLVFRRQFAKRRLGNCMISSILVCLRRLFHNNLSPCPPLCTPNQIAPPIIVVPFSQNGTRSGKLFPKYLLST